MEETVKEKQLAEKNAVDLTCFLLRQGIKITFLDGSEKEIQKFSPPLYYKFYNTQTLPPIKQ